MAGNSNRIYSNEAKINFKKIRRKFEMDNGYNLTEYLNEKYAERWEAKKNNLKKITSLYLQLRILRIGHAIYLEVLII